MHSLANPPDLRVFDPLLLSRTGRAGGRARARRVVHFNETVYLSGITGAEEGNTVELQTANVLRKIDERLALAGTDKSKLLTATM